jgi:predicted amino acid dehydrogenase
MNNEQNLASLFIVHSFIVYFCFVSVSFALLGHPANYDHLDHLLHQLRPDLAPEHTGTSPEGVAQLFELVPSYAEKATLSAAPNVNGKLIVCTFLPDRLTSPKQLTSAYHKTRDACQLAKELGSKIAGLGGFTSITIAGKINTLSDELDIALTSGSSLTSALALAQIEGLLDKLRSEINNQTIAILGASGEIGQACLNALAPRAQRVIAIARNKNKLEQLIADSRAVFASADPRDAYQADIIIAATSSAQPLLHEADLKRGAIVCDIGYPKTIVESPSPRPDVLIFAGGLAESELTFDLHHIMGLPSPRLMYGCFGETITLALAQRYENYSDGESPITVERMDEILALARAHGFRPAPLYRGRELITEEILGAHSILHER